MNQAVTGQTDSGMIDSEEEMMDGAGSSGADSGNVSYKAADLLKTVRTCRKSVKTPTNSCFGSQVSLFWSEVSVL